MLKRALLYAMGAAAALISFGCSTPYLLPHHRL